MHGVLNEKKKKPAINDEQITQKHEGKYLIKKPRVKNETLSGVGLGTAFCYQPYDTIWLFSYIHVLLWFFFF